MRGLKVGNLAESQKNKVGWPLILTRRGSIGILQARCEDTAVDESDPCLGRGTISLSPWLISGVVDLSEGALDDPVARQHLKTFRPVRALDDLHCPLVDRL